MQEAAIAGQLIVRDPWEDAGAAYHSAFCIGNVSVELVGSRLGDVALDSSLEPFRTYLGLSGIHIQIKWVPEITPAARRQVFDSGYSWRLYEGEKQFQFDFFVPACGKQPYKRLIVDHQFCEAILEMSEKSFEGTANRFSPLAYPLDELLIMHRLTQENAIELHGCGIVGTDGTGNLFVGHSGAGKSTTTRLWTKREGYEALSDDRIIVRRRGDLPKHCDDGLESLRLLEWPALPAIPLAQDERRARRRSASDDEKKMMRMYGTPWHGEGMYASPDSAQLARIFILEHGQKNAVTPLAPGQAVAELFARSFVPFHRHEYVDAALEFLQEVVDAVPVYRFAFEPDQRAVDVILNFHD